MTAQMAARYCPSCDNLGLIQVQYRSGESFDLAICTCHAGVIWAARGEAAIRQQFQLKPDQQVAWLEDVGDADSVPSSKSDAFVAAGQTPKKRAKL